MSLGHLFAAGVAVAAALRRPSRREALGLAESRRLEVVALSHRVGSLEAQNDTYRELQMLSEDERDQCHILDGWPCQDGSRLADETDLEAA